MVDQTVLLDQSSIAHLVALARRAGDAIMAVYHDAAGFAVEQKADDSPVTQADMAAHHIIMEGLPAILALPMISEEAPLPLLAERKTWSRYWLIDPLDGTREFILRSGEFTVNIALIEKGVPVLGVVHLPAQQTTYVGLHHIVPASLAGAWKYVQDLPAEKIQVRSLTSATDHQELVVLASRRHGTDAVMHLLDHLGRHWSGTIALTNAGSSLKFCRIAEGEADFYPRLAPTCEWDTAAAQAVLVAAGGAVVNAATMEPLGYNQGESVLNPDFYAVGDVNLDWRALLDAR